VQAWFGRGQEEAIGVVGQAFVGTEYADQLIDFIVVRLDILIGNGPVGTQPVNIFSAEIVGAKAQGNTPPVVGAPAQHPGAEPAKVGPFPLCVGFSLNFPSAPGHVKVAKSAVGVCATAGAFVGPAHLCFGDRVGRVKERPGFHNGYRQALLRQHLGRHAAAGTGAYDDGIVGFGRFLDFHD
jgi:hypothetical protein